MLALVIGQGSIGQRHARLLRELGHEVHTVSAHLPEGAGNHRDLREALAAHAFGYVVVASPTSRHREALATLQAAQWQGATLVEKPLFESTGPGAVHPAGPTFVAYNLRFHPVLRALREALAEQRITSVTAYAGQYLPDWRPGRDYRETSSARRASGGGVLRDLSHELDYLRWIFGPWRAVTGLQGRFGPLEIEGEDTASFLAHTERCPVLHLEVNYLDRIGRRTVAVNTHHHTYLADLTAGTLRVDDRTHTFPLDRDQTYRDQHRAILEGSATHLCTYAEGLATVALIDRLESLKGPESWTPLP